MSPKREYVAKIERQIRTVKERTRYSTASLLNCGIKHLHKQIVIHLVYNVTLWLNSFPINQSLSLNFSPREIVTQQSISLGDKCNAGFGSYVQATTDAIVTNNQKPRTHGCIALGPSGNRQGSLKCFDLETGMVVIRRIVKVFPMPDRVVKKVNAWVIKTKRIFQ